MAPPTSTVSHTYESTDIIKPVTQTTPTNNNRSNDSHIYEFPDKVVPNKATPTVKPPVPIKPILPPKPVFLKHAIHKGEDPPQQQEQQQIATPPQQVQQRMYEDVLPLATPIGNKKPQQEPIYDEPPRIDPRELATNKRPPNEPIYDQPPREKIPPSLEECDKTRGLQLGRVQDVVYGDASTEEQQYGNVTEQQYGNVTEQQYGNVTEPQYGNVSETQEPTYGNTDSFSSDQPPQTDSNIPPLSPVPSIGISYRAQFQYTALNDGEVSFNQGDLLISCSSESAQDGWIKVEKDGKRGWAPINYLQPLKIAGTKIHYCNCRASYSG